MSDLIRKDMVDEWVSVLFDGSPFPCDGEKVLVTYIGYGDGKFYCDAIAYRRDGNWYWDDGEEVDVTILAWKKCGNPYRLNKNEYEKILKNLDNKILYLEMEINLYKKQIRQILDSMKLLDDM